MKTMDKRIILSLPSALYQDVKKRANKSYLSVSGYIRESLLERAKEKLTPREEVLIEGARKHFRQGKGISWRQIKRKV